MTRSSKKPMTQVSVRISLDDRKKLLTIGRAMGYNVSNVLRVAIAFAINNPGIILDNAALVDMQIEEENKAKRKKENLN
jgi:hypothetical protein